MTYSVIAYDSESGGYGVAVQSHWFNVARTAAWTRLGVGAVVTQAMTDPSYGWRGLDLMSAGSSAGDALARLLEEDPDADRRQVGFVDREGTVTVHTGARCIRYAGHIAGEGWAVLGNLLAGTRVLPAMADVFAQTSGDLPERMVATLEAAQTEGGDLRGMQSAAIRVLPGGTDLGQGAEAAVDLSVADHEDPITELGRLVAVDRSYRELGRARTALGRGDETQALYHLRSAEQLRHGVEIDFWRSIALAQMSRFQDATDVLSGVFTDAPQFEEVLRRLAEVDPVPARLLACYESTSSDIR